MYQVLKYYRVQACIRTASFKVRTSPHFEDRSYVGNRVFFPAVFFWLRTVWMTTGRSVGGAGGGLVWGCGAGGTWYWVWWSTWASRGGRGWPWWCAVGVGATEDRVALARPQTLSSK